MSPSPLPQLVHPAQMQKENAMFQEQHLLTNLEQFFPLSLETTEAGMFSSFADANKDSGVRFVFICLKFTRFTSVSRRGSPLLLGLELVEDPYSCKQLPASPFDREVHIEMSLGDRLRVI